MLRIVSVSAFLLMILANQIFAQTLAEKVQEHRLDNGATLLMVERHESPTVAAYISFRVGSVNESNSDRGVAHLLEHMLFKGTKTLGTKNYRQEKKLIQQIEAVGVQLDLLKNQEKADQQKLQQLRDRLARLQDEQREFVIKDEFSRIYAENGGIGYNAFTGKDSTTYLINLPSNKLELWAAIESDRLENAVFREFFTERDVVHEERRRSYESSPDGMLYEALLATAYTVHPYRNPIIGWNSDIENLNPEKISSFFSRYYRPVNMVITLVGDFIPGDAIALVEKYFGKLERGVPVPPVVDQEPPQRGERRVAIDFDAENRLMIAFHKPTLPTREDYVFDILMQVLSAGRTSRLHRSLVIEQQLVSDVGVFSAPGSRYDNLMVLSMTPAQTSSIRDVEKAVYREFERLKEEPLQLNEINKARKQITTSMLRRLQDNSGLARMLSSYQLLGDWRYLVDYEQQLTQISAQEVMAVAKRYLNADNRTVATLGRKDEKK